MTRKIFKNILAVSVTVLLVCVLCISYVLYEYFGAIIERELEAEAILISQGLKQDQDYLENMNRIENRVTLVDTDGTVLYDSDADVKTLGNHMQRKEIREAMEKGAASVVRYSDTLATKTIYYAQRLEDGKILRIAQEQNTVALLLRGILGPVILILVVVILLTLAISRAVSRRIVAPINEMDLNCPDADEPYPELAPLMVKIRQQNKHIEMQLAEMERKQKEFTAITEHMNEGFLLIDSNMEILSYNTAALNLLGEGKVQKPHTAFELNRSKGFRQAVEGALSAKRSQQPLETETNCYHIMANPVTEGGTVVGAVVLVVDVTEKEQREKLRREFTSNVSHELKTPLTTIYGVSDMMAEGIVKQTDVRRFAKTIKDESGHMISLIDDIIKLSKLDENAAPEERTAIDLMTVAEDAIERLLPKAQEKDVALSLQGESTIIHSVSSLCDEIVYNLCENAIKYNKEHGSVTVSVGKDGKGAVLSVEDTGIGIPFQYRDRVFERFFRVDKSHCQQVDGTGLGLSIVKHAVAYVGGTIALESVEGTGTKVTVRFPPADPR